MVEKINLISLILLSVLIATAVFISGCTLGTKETAVTETPTVQPTEEQTTPTVESSSASTIKVPWPQDENPVPPYSDEEKTSLIEEAKEEIMRVFPDVSGDTLNDYVWGSHHYAGYRVPAIVFSNVSESSDIGQRTVEIVYDSSQDIITKYGSARTSFDDNDTAIVTTDEAKERAIEFYKDVMGDEYEFHKYDFVTIRDFDDLNSVFLYVEIATTYEGVVYFNDHTWVVYDMRYDGVNNYIDEYINRQNNPDVLSQITTLSPTPDITIDEAKKILEAQLKDDNGGNEVEIEYCQRNQYSDFPNLQWLDEPYYMDIEGGYVTSPLKLIWELPFTTADGSIHYGIIDAHTGEIIDIQS
ncbi:hypothetical protein Mpet_1596 [Methanolacinia petrolearia DSM 11571]|uniref:Uncharacterized protein n=1 Tax=Methanolacinia petrolearia (strain DSM 11571 / OCM 486 / SEBR 4847) TaxID=679926 RepID=E1RGQ8_METP4|nr:hypothetical protein [Methanolacinia petrolearia]ADN36353.1 hypothetical protein Mpet_1596 [Methanolacinia petrolearia DSM 11571]